MIGTITPCAVAPATEKREAKRTQKTTANDLNVIKFSGKFGMVRRPAQCLTFKGTRQVAATCKKKSGRGRQADQCDINILAPDLIPPQANWTKPFYRMKQESRNIKLLSTFSLALLVAAVLLVGNSLVQPVESRSAGAPSGFTGAPDENVCSACHSDEPHMGQFTINAPSVYVPGRTYQVQVRHATNDVTRLRWGFQLTALSGMNAAGTFANLSDNTQIQSDNGRFYIGHTANGTFAGQASGATWTFDWVAPTTDAGRVSFYAAGNQADNNNGGSGDQIYTASVVSRPSDSPADFDGDGKSDLSIYRPAVGEWFYQKSSDGVVPGFQFGASTDKIVPGDYTGDGKTDIAIWRPSNGFWFILRSEDFLVYGFPFGTDGDVPVPGDYDGDGKTDAAVFRPTTVTWIINKSSGGVAFHTFGAAGDKPVVADYDGDGKTDIAIYRPSVGEWYYQRSSDGVVPGFQFGSSTDKPVQGDYTGDGKADIAFWRPSTGFWYVLRSEDFLFYGFPWGLSTDLPAPGDFDGDGKMDASVFRPSDTVWYINRSTAGVFIQQFGAAADKPVPSAFIP
jgi:hypothetical protein